MIDRNRVSSESYLKMYVDIVPGDIYAIMTEKVRFDS